MGPHSVHGCVVGPHSVRAPPGCRYDEFVFNSPSEGLRQRLMTEVVPSSKGWRQSPHAKWLTDYDNEAPQESLQQVYQMVTAELQNASKRRRLLEDELIAKE